MTNYRGIANRLRRGRGKPGSEFVRRGFKATFKLCCRSADGSCTVCLAVCPSVCWRLIGTPECLHVMNNGRRIKEKLSCNSQRWPWPFKEVLIKAKAVTTTTSMEIYLTGGNWGQANFKETNRTRVTEWKSSRVNSFWHWKKYIYCCR